MKKTAFFFFMSIIASLTSFSQITYLADTAFTTDAGYGGAAASCIYTGGYFFGLYDGYNTGWWLADEFTVPASTTWVFDTVIVYNIQDGSSSSSPFTGAYLQIYQGTPGAGGTVVWGNTTSNIIATTGFTGIYRVDTFTSSGGLLGTQRPIMYLKLFLSSPPHLSSGTYWLVWSVDASGPGSIYCPPKVLPGRINPLGQVARQDSSGAWRTISDRTNNVGFNKVIKASAHVSVPNISNSGAFVLDQNVPNPVYDNTKITFHLQQGSYTTLCVYNTLGQLVNKLVDDNLNAGDHQYIFHVHDLSPGIYYYQLRTNTGIESKQMQLLH